MTEDMKKEIARERSKKYYYANKEKVLTKQKKYRKVRLENATPEELKKIKQGNYARYSKYRSNHREKIAEYQRKYIAKKRGLGEVPKTKDMIIKELQQENKKLKGVIETYEILIKANNINNWNELKKWLEEQYKLNDLIYYNDIDIVNPKKARIEHISKREELKEILDKMQEFEEKR